MEARSSGGSSAVKSSNGNAGKGASSGARSSGTVETHMTVQDDIDNTLNFHATTIIKTIKCHYLWTISNYTFVKDKDESIKSPKFTTPDKTEWRVPNVLKINQLITKLITKF